MSGSARRRPRKPQAAHRLVTRVGSAALASKRVGSTPRQSEAAMRRIRVRALTRSSAAAAA